jgi:exopolysaccharide production protein ExoZ
MGGGKTLFTVQALRAFAAASVVVHHILMVAVQRAGYQYNFPFTAAAGVDLFFLISGFIMLYTHFDNFGEVRASSSFIRRRLIRIVPLYWIVTTGTVIILLIAPSAFSTLKLDWHSALFSYFFLLSKMPNGDLNTIVVTGWSLCYEMYFYALLALLLFLPRRVFLLAAGAIFALGLIIGVSPITVPPWTTAATNPLLLEFYAGTIIAHLFIRGYYLPPAIAVIGIVISVAAIVGLGTPAGGNWMRVLYWGVPSSIILLSAISLEKTGLRVPNLLIALGDSSYSLYLIHIFVVASLAKFWAYAHLTTALPVYVLGLVSFVAAIVISHLVHLRVESPVTRWLKSRIPSRAIAAQALKSPFHSAPRSGESPRDYSRDEVGVDQEIETSALTDAH